MAQQKYNPLLKKGFQEISSGGGGGGEVNTASNIGSGEGVFAAKVGVDLQLKSLVAGENTSITSTANEITFSNTGFLQTGRTTGNVQLTLYSSKAVANNTVQSFVIRVSAIQSGTTGAGTVGDVWVHEFRGAIKQISGVTSVVDTVTDELIAEDTATAGFSVSVEAGTGSIDIKVTGELNKTIEWKAVSIFNEVLI
jgi:hypothetical protein